MRTFNLHVQCVVSVMLDVVTFKNLFLKMYRSLYNCMSNILMNYVYCRLFIVRLASQNVN